MKIIKSQDEIIFNSNSVVTIGSFDGVHLGHRAILDFVTERTRSLSGRSVVVTFNPHPRDVVGRGPVQRLCTLEERMQHLEQAGIDETLIINFTYEFSQQSARTFYEQWLVKKIGVREVIIGHDHMFGKNREGSIETLKQIGQELQFGVVMIPEVCVSDKVVSSSLIRECVSQGRVEEAAKYLGRPYSIQATVVQGDGRGKTLGFPTANLLFDHTSKMTPASGVYFVQVHHAQECYSGMMNIGVRPTFGTNGQQFIEVHLLDFKGNLYGETLSISFIKRLRSEKKFNSVDELVAQLHQDRHEAEKLVSQLTVIS
ncbi:MAG: bifunctional riboflavin kinase/FAD synthetase [Ignavibacteriales bacterium]|nr:bifunctional riboflavin kinase/FAD synthetase [Ignavibacteriales bacterium]